MSWAPGVIRWHQDESWVAIVVDLNGGQYQSLRVEDGEIKLIMRSSTEPETPITIIIECPGAELDFNSIGIRSNKKHAVLKLQKLLPQGGDGFEMISHRRLRCFKEPGREPLEVRYEDWMREEPFASWAEEKQALPAAESAGASKLLGYKLRASYSTVTATLEY